MNCIDTANNIILKVGQHFYAELIKRQMLYNFD